ncbi:MAG: hypothetical protein ABSH14_00350 [Verrucomicrobiia bacterium]
MIADSDARKAILYSVVASIIVIVFIQPLLGIMGHALNWFGTNVYMGFVDSIYASAARGDRNQSSIMLLSLVTSVSIGCSIGFLTAAPQIAKKASPDAPLPETREGLEKEKERLLGVVGRLERRARIGIRIGQVLAVLFCIAAFISLTGVSADHKLNVLFNQQLNALAPQITDREYKELVAQWAMMRNHGDYNSIKAKMDDIAQQSGIKLPNPPSLW